MVQFPKNVGSFTRVLHVFPISLIARLASENFAISFLITRQSAFCSNSPGYRFNHTKHQQEIHICILDTIRVLFLTAASSSLSFYRQLRVIIGIT